MIQVQPCCAETRRDLKSAHKRVASLTFQLLLLAAQVADLIATRAAEHEAHAVEVARLNEVIERLERELADAYSDLADTKHNKEKAA
jgi:hypothetical protein